MHSMSKACDSWKACPAGELQRMVGRIKTCQRRQFLRKLGGLSAGVAAVGAGGYLAAWWLSTSAAAPPGGITCAEVRPMFAAYHAGRLDAALAERVAAHLRECSHCGSAYRRKYGPRVA